MAEKIFPEMPGTEISPTAAELDEASGLIAAGYLDPSACRKMEPRVKTAPRTYTVEQALREERVSPDDPNLPRDGDGKILFFERDENEKIVPTTIDVVLPVLGPDRRPVFETDGDGRFILEEGPPADWDTRQGRLLYAVQHMSVSSARRDDLLRVLHKMEVADSRLSKQAAVMAERIDSLLCAENPPATEDDMIAELEKSSPHIPVREYLEKHMAAKTANPEITYEEYATTFAGARVSSRLARVVGDVAKEIAKLDTPEAKESMLDMIEDALDQAVSIKSI